MERSFRKISSHNGWLILLIIITLLGVVYFQSFKAARINPKSLFEDVSNISTLIKSFLKPDLFVGSVTFPFFGPSPTLKLVIQKLWESIAIGILSTTFSSLIASPLSFVASKNVIDEGRLGRTIYLLVRGTLSILRAIEPW